MENFSTSAGIVKPCNQKNTEKRGQNSPAGQVAQGIAPNENFFANLANTDTFSVPRTALFYLFAHGASATLTIAKADAALADAESLVEIRKAKITEYAATGKDTEAAEILLSKAQKKLERAKNRAAELPELPAGMRGDFAGNGDFLGFSKTNKKKGFEKVELNYSIFYQMACLPSNERALAMLAIIFLFSQIRRVGKSWRDREVFLECTLRDFKEFAGAGANVTTRLLRLALAAITTAKITIKSGKKLSTGNFFAAGGELDFDKNPPADNGRAPRKRGISLKLKPNKFLARLVERTHAIRADAAKLLNARNFLLYLELKSAQAVGFEKTLIKNAASAAGFIAEPAGKKHRCAGRIVKRVKAAIKRIAAVDRGFGWQVGERADDPRETRIIFKAPPLLPLLPPEPLTTEFIQKAALPANIAPLPTPAAHVVKLKSVGEKFLEWLGVDF